MILADAGSGLGGFGVLIVGLIVVILGFLWVIFPFVVSSGLNTLAKLLKKQNELLSSIADRQNETNKALQFLVNDRSRRP